MLMKLKFLRVCKIILIEIGISTMLLLFFSLLLTLGNGLNASSSPPEEMKTIKTTGRYTWKLILDIDNSNNSGSVRRQVSVDTVVECSYNKVIKYLEHSDFYDGFKVNLSGTYFELLNIGVHGALDHKVKSEYEHLATSKLQFSTKVTQTDTFEVGPLSTLKLYQLVFHGPGISYLTDTLSSTPHPQPDVAIDIKLRTVYVLQDIDVVYTSDSISRPEAIITEVNGGNPDINAGFGGRYVWLLPVWTNRVKDQGATGIQIVSQWIANYEYKDLASGALGKYRYIKILRDAKNSNRRSSNSIITQVALYRSDVKLDSAPAGWQFVTGDINEGRMMDYLYIVYNTKLYM